MKCGLTVSKLAHGVVGGMLAASSNLSNFIQVVVSLEKACSAFFIAGPGRKQACRCACLLPPAYIARSHAYVSPCCLIL